MKYEGVALEGMSMANKDRHKRSARKARAAERERLEAARAESQPELSKREAKKAEKAVKKAEASKPSKKEPEKKGFLHRIRTWFADVKTEMHRVTWPSRTELKNFSLAVIVMLVVFGVCVWLVDSGVVGVLVGYSGLRIG